MDEAIANCVRVDHFTVEAVEALREAGVRPLLLKGPAIAQWLYAEDTTRRAYSDADLLVAPSDLARAAVVLTELGYECVEPFDQRLPHSRPRHAECWYRTGDRSAIDLHRCIHGTERVSPGLVWQAATTDIASVDVLERTLDAPGEVFRLMHLVLHLRPKDHPGSRAWSDVEAAVAAVPVDSWQGAAELARRLGVDSRMGPLLRMVAGGDRVADRVHLPRVWPRWLRWEFNARSDAARFAAEIAEKPWPDGLLLLVERLVPPPSYLRSAQHVGDTLGALVGGYIARLSNWRNGIAGLGSLRAERHGDP